MCEPWHWQHDQRCGVAPDRCVLVDCMSILCVHVIVCHCVSERDEKCVSPGNGSTISGVALHPTGVFECVFVFARLMCVIIRACCLPCTTLVCI